MVGDRWDIALWVAVPYQFDRRDLTVTASLDLLANFFLVRRFTPRQ